MPWNPDYYKTGLAARAQRDAAQYNLKLKKKKKRRPRPKAASSKRQASSSKRLKEDIIK